ncbi:MAG: hypothetical protein FWB78_04660 [Treponema sp.]|nr:hypothetical protein [Treponema sp.]
MREALDEDAEQRLLECFVKKQQRGAGLWQHVEDSDAERRSLKYLLKSEGFSSTAIERFFED